jgi:ribosomal protein L30
MRIIEIEQTGSPIRRHHLQRTYLKGLGLNRIGRKRSVPDTPQYRGLIGKVRHLLRVTYPPAENKVSELSLRRFNALAGYIRNPATILIFEELGWYASSDERVIGMLVRDHADDDYGWIILGRDERLRFRAIDVNSSLEDIETARRELIARLKEWHAKSDEAYHSAFPRRQHCVDDAPVVSATFAAGTLARVSFRVSKNQRCEGRHRERNDSQREEHTKNLGYRKARIGSNPHKITWRVGRVS